MSTIVTCSCGVKVRLPADSAGKTFRCPRCGAEFVAAAADRVMTFGRVAEPLGQGVCPICQSDLQAGAAILTCPECGQAHHRECWAEVGGCSTYGCAQAPALVKDEAAAPARSAWGDTKNCPACGETIKAIAVKCRYCGTTFDTVDPLTAGDLRRRARKQDKYRSLRTGISVLFAFTLIGCTAPVTMAVALAWFLPNRREAAKAGPFFLALGYSALAISVLYCVLIVIFLVFGGL
jgi:predicted RNA-binding Zn-ribbon protein involved in translation (DUF1610 family)